MNLICKGWIIVKKTLPILLSVLVLVILALFLIFNQKEHKPKALVTEFTENFFTNNSNDSEIYKKYFTKDAFEKFRIDDHLMVRTRLTSTKDFNTEIRNLTIKDISKDNSERIAYEITFTLIDKNTNKEKQINHPINLSKENNTFKIDLNNKIETLALYLELLLEE